MGQIRLRSFVCKALLIALLSASLQTISRGQISDQEAVNSARRYLDPFVDEDINDEPRVVRESMSVRGKPQEMVSVHFKDATVSLNAAGHLRGLSIDGPASQPRTEKPEKFKSDEEAWRAIEAVLDKLAVELPPNLERDKLTKSKQAYKEYVYTFYKRPKPYGYGNSSGNYVAVQLHRVTGALRHVSIARGWTYEKPNLQTSHQEAIQAAISVLGGTETEWTGKQLRFMSVAYERAPPHIRELLERQVMRLMYIISSKRGSVVVDSVTGDVVDVLDIDGTSVMPISGLGEPIMIGPGAQSEDGQSYYGLACFGAGVGLFLLFTRSIRAKRPRGSNL